MMILNDTGVALATQCLWSLQEAAPEIEGLLFTHVDGLTITTTLPGSESTQRLAAVATTLFLLGEHTAEAWGSGEALEVQLGFTDKQAVRRYVTIKPVSYRAILVALHRRTERHALIKGDLDLAATYLLALLVGDMPPLPVNWHSR